LKNENNLYSVIGAAPGVVVVGVGVILHRRTIPASCANRIIVREALSANHALLASAPLRDPFVIAESHAVEPIATGSVHQRGQTTRFR